MIRNLFTKIALISLIIEIFKKFKNSHKFGTSPYKNQFKSQKVIFSLGIRIYLSASQICTQNFIQKWKFLLKNEELYTKVKNFTQK